WEDGAALTRAAPSSVSALRPPRPHQSGGVLLPSRKRLQTPQGGRRVCVNITIRSQRNPIKRARILLVQQSVPHVPRHVRRIALRQNTTGGTLSVASTGMVRTPDGKAVASIPARSGRAPVPPELKVMISKFGTILRLPRDWPETDDPPRSGGFHSAEAPSAAT